MNRDVTIIGAGPAGSLAATRLARAGWDVTLFEQSRFPRDKVCGESLSAMGIDVLKRAGLDAQVTKLEPTLLTRTALHAGDGRSVSLPLPRPMWGVSRRAMDTVLLDAARAAGATILQPARCESVNGTLAVRDLVTNTIEHLCPSWTILADGKGALLPVRPTPTTDFGVKAHFRDVRGPRDAVELFGVDGHYVGLAPIEDARFNVAFSVPASRVEQFRGDFDRLWRQLHSENPTLAARFDGSTLDGPWLASPLPRFPVARAWPDRVIPLGNAAAALEPIGGEGIGLALRSAELAAEYLIESTSTGTPLRVRRLRAEFARLWRTRRLACRALARLLSAPTIAGDVVELAQGNQWVTRAALALIGKT